MTIDQERASTSKFNIRQALKSIGVDVPVTKRFDEYPPYITGAAGHKMAEVTVTCEGGGATEWVGAIVDPDERHGRKVIENETATTLTILVPGVLYCPIYPPIQGTEVTIDGDKISQEAPGYLLFYIGGDGAISVVFPESTDS